MNAVSFVAVSCFQASADAGASKLARAVLGAAGRVAPKHRLAVFLDEAIGADGEILAELFPLLPTEHALCMLVGDPRDCLSIAKEMERASRKTIFWRKLDTMSENLRLQAVFENGRGVVSEESPYFTEAVLKRGTLSIERLPAGLPLYV